MDEEFIRQMELMMDQSLQQMGPAAPSSPHAVKEKPLSPPRYLVKREPLSPPRYLVKREPTSPLRRMEEEPASHSLRAQP